jgi:hypothetical protein
MLGLFHSLKYTQLAFLTAMLLMSGCGSGPCDYPDDRARDGSRCGDRAASVRPGGRNPDLYKFFYGVLIVGGGFLVFNLVARGSQKSNSYDSNRTNHIQSSKIQKRREEKPKAPVSNSIQKENMLAAIERVLWKEFDYKIDHMFVETYREIAASSEKQNYTPSDGAILYMLAVISFMKPSLADDKAKSFVHKHITTCQRLLPSGNLPQEETSEHLQMVKKYFS